MSARLLRALAAAVFACAVLSTPSAGAADEAPAASAGAPVTATALEADAASVGKAERSVGRSAATLVVFNRKIITFRVGFLGNTPRERAIAGRERIMAILARGGPGVVSIESVGPGAAIKIDGLPALFITKDDADPLRGITFDALLAATVSALEQAIGETHEARSGELMVAAALWAGGATAVFLVLLWALGRVGRAVTRRMLQFADETASHIRIGGSEILQRERTARFVRRLLQVGFWAIVLLLAYEWLGYVLSRFPYTRPWGEQLNAFLVDSSFDILSSVAAAVPDLLVAVAIFFIARGVTGMLGTFFSGVQSGRISVGWIDADSARPTRRIASFAVWIFALVMAYPYIPGSGSEAFKGLSVLLGLMLSIGASGIVGQAASGMILMYTRTFRPGEYVRIADHEGTIVEMGMFTTRLRTGMGEELTLPNSLVLGNVTHNYSRSVKGTGFVIDASTTIGYDAPWRQVHAMLMEAARRTQGVLADPAPRVYQTALSDFYVEYRLVCQAVPADPRPRAEVVSNLYAEILDVFNENGVQIMSPHYFADPSHAKVVPPDKWYTAPAAPPAPDAAPGSTRK